MSTPEAQANAAAVHDRRYIQNGEHAAWNIPGQGTPFADLDDYLSSDWFPNQAGNLLELGCGGGQGAIRAIAAWQTKAAITDGILVTGIDFAPTAIAMAKRNYAAADLTQTIADFRVGTLPDALNDLAANSYISIIDNHCMHCIPDPPDRLAILRQCFRVLQSGGTMFSGHMPNTKSSFPAGATQVEHSASWSDTYRYYADPQEYAALFARVGFVAHLAVKPDLEDDFVVIGYKPDLAS